MSVILPQSSIKPAMWMCDPGTVAYNCAQMGLPVPDFAVPLWERAGNRIFNYGRWNNNGTFQNNPTWERGGIYFDNAAPSDYIQILHHPLFSPGSHDFSVATKITKLQTTSSWSNTFCFSKWRLLADGDNNAWNLTLTTDGIDDQARFEIRLAGANKNVDIGADLTIGAEYFLVGVRQGDNIYIYLDGILKNTTSGCSGAITDGSSYNVNIAANVDGQYATKMRCEFVHYYNCALSPSQVQILYNNPYGIVEPIRSPAIWSIPVVGVAPTGALYGPFGGNFMGPI